MNEEPTDAATPTNSSDEDAWDADAPSGGELDETTRQVLVGLAVVALATGLFISVVSAMDAISTWLEPHWVPVAQAAFGLAIVVGSMAALGWLRRQGEP